MQIRTRRLNAEADGIAEAARLLREGNLVAFPTETVYGLGADATNSRAVADLFAVKGRPNFNPLIAHVPDLEAAFRLGVFSAEAKRLAHAFWPGPLTLVVPAHTDCAVAELARAGLPSIAIRIPENAAARAIIALAGRPVVAPSANRSGHISPSEADHVGADLDGSIAAIVDGGPTPIGVESTIVGCLDDVTLLRPGGLSREQIETLLGHRLRESAHDGNAPRAPGMLRSHYAPRHRLRLNARHVEPGEACLGFGLPLPHGARPDFSVNLSPAGDLTEAAANLYAHLRTLDARDCLGIAVAPVPGLGLGEAIRDRLARAAAPREAADDMPSPGERPATTKFAAS